MEAVVCLLILWFSYGSCGLPFDPVVSVLDAIVSTYCNVDVTVVFHKSGINIFQFNKKIFI